jgi:hypothetical protein
VRENGGGVVIASNADLDIDNTESITVSLWFKQDSFSTTTYDRKLFQKGGGANIGYECYNAYSTQTVNCRLRSGATIYNSTSPTFALNTWYHLAYVIDGTGNGTGTVYLNGVPNTPATLGDLNISNANSFYIGYGNIGSSGTYSGTIDDVRVYNRVLSATEVQQLYKLGSTKLGVTPVATSTATGTGVNSGLVGHWTFDGKDTVWTSTTTGTTRDSSGNNNTGTLTSMNRATSPVMGKIGQGLYFDGINNRLDMVSSFSNAVPNGYSTSVWIKSTDHDAQIYVKGNSGGIELATGGGGIVCAVRRQDGLFIQSDTGAGDWWGTNPGALDGRWHHIGCVLDRTSNRISLYVDGVFAISGDTTGLTSLFNDNSPFHMGAASNQANPYAGSLDDMRLYDRTLSATEIQQLYKLGQAKTR